MTRPAAALAALLLLLAASGPAAAQQGGVIVTPPPPGLVETAIASCAGGAAIGALAVYATGIGSIGSTAGLFCGLSVAASLASTAAIWTWRTATGVQH
jgi:hypothetical protein